MLQIRIRHGDAARYGSSIVRTDLIYMGMYTAISVAVFHDGIDEGAGGLVKVPRLGDELREGMLVFLEKEFSEARCALFSCWVMDADFIERFSERLRSPDFNISARDALDLFRDIPFPLEEAIPSSLNPVNIDANAPHRHVNETWEQIKFEVRNRPQIFFSKLNGEVVPEFEGQFSVTFSVRSDVHGWHLPHFSFRIDTELPRSLH